MSQFYVKIVGVVDSLIANFNPTIDKKNRLDFSLVQLVRLESGQCVLIRAIFCTFEWP